MDVTVCLDRGVYCCGDTLSGIVCIRSRATSLSVSASAIEHALQLQAHKDEVKASSETKDLTTSFSIQVHVYVRGRAHFVSRFLPENHEEKVDVELLHSCGIQSETVDQSYFSLAFEAELPEESLPPTCPRGSVLRCVYYVEVELRSVNAEKNSEPIRVLRVPFVLRIKETQIDGLSTREYRVMIQSMERQQNTTARRDWKQTPKLSDNDTVTNDAGDDMMEKRLAGLEADLRLALVNAGQSVPDKDWYLDASDLEAHSETDWEYEPISKPVWYRVAQQGNIVARVQLNSARHYLDDIIRGRFLFECTSCTSVDVALVTVEHIEGQKELVEETRIVWAAYEASTQAGSLSQFALPLPPESLAPPNFCMNWYRVEWRLDFNFTISPSSRTVSQKVTAPTSSSSSSSSSSATSERSFSTPISASTQHMQWVLPLQVEPRPPTNYSSMNISRCFFISTNELGTS